MEISFLQYFGEENGAMAIARDGVCMSVEMIEVECGSIHVDMDVSRHRHRGGRTCRERYNRR